MDGESDNASLSENGTGREIALVKLFGRMILQELFKDTQTLFPKYTDQKLLTIIWFRWMNSRTSILGENSTMEFFRLVTSVKAI